MIEQPQDKYASEEFMRPFVTAWLEKLRMARQSRKSFDDVAEQCKHFYQGAVGFMWEPSFRARFMGNMKAPTFKVTIAKAFELVAIVGPVLYWDNPKRYISPRERIEYTPDMFGQDPNDPMLQQYFQMVMQQEQQEAAQETVRNKLMNKALNYMPGEQPSGGLAMHSQTAITEALVKGRGCLWTEPYQMPSSKRLLVGSFYDTVDDLLIDPDSKDPTLHDAKWIARRRRVPIHECEKKFGLPKDSLRTKGALESIESQAERSSDADQLDRSTGATFDMIEYFEIWSKGGVGSNLQGVNRELTDAFDDVMGDYVYMAVAPNVPYFLNAPSDKLRGATDDDVKKLLEWPIPFWTDQRWPVSVLDFYPRLDSPWPMAPLAPGLGELMFLNVMISRMLSHIYSSTRDILFVLRSAAQDVEAALKEAEDNAVVYLNDMNKTIQEAVQVFQQKPMNSDGWHIVEMISQQFDRRVGLTELVYGLNPGGVQSRTAADITAKQENLSVRPDYMSRAVEKWQTEVADKEKFCLHWFVKGSDLQPLLGTIGSALWDQHVANADPEVVVREMRATLEAGSAKKPNKQKDTANLNAIMPVLFPELSKHADITFDTGPLNNLLVKLGDAHEMDMQGLTMQTRQPQPPPPPPPEVQQQMQQQQQMEQAKMQAELQLKQMDAQIKQIEVQIKQMELQLKQVEAQNEVQAANVEMQKEQMKLQLEQVKGQQKMEQEKMKAEMDMQVAIQKGQVELQQTEQEGEIKMQQAVMEAETDLQIKKMEFQMQAQQAAEQHHMNSVHAEEQHQQSLQQSKAQGALDIQLAKQKAKAAPKKPSGGSGKTGKK